MMTRHKAIHFSWSELFCSKVIFFHFRFSVLLFDFTGTPASMQHFAYLWMPRLYLFYRDDLLTTAEAEGEVGPVKSV